MINVSVGSLVLDLGCGTGHLATILSDMVGPEGKVIAVDPDAERIKVAKEVNARSNIKYLVADDQSFPGDEYNVIVSTHVIHWIKDKESFFKRVFEKLAVNGLFGMVTYDGYPQYPPVFRKCLSGLFSADFEKSIFSKIYFEKIEKYLVLAAKTGFQVVSKEIFTTEWGFNSVDEFVDFWAGISHEDLEFDVASVQKATLRTFKDLYEQDLKTEVVNLPTVCLILAKH